MRILKTPKPGYTRNPLRQRHGNLKCICDSKRKVKNCCGMSKYVPEKWAADVKEVLITFMENKENEL